MPKGSDKFLGSWSLVPELCQYQDGHPPLSSDYKIDLKNNDVHFDVSWVDEKEKAHHIEFGGPVDGTVNPHNGGKIEVSFTRIDDLRLDSSTYHNGFEASYVHRKASQDGKLMIVVTVQNHQDEGSTRNFQVYRRR